MVAVVDYLDVTLQESRWMGKIVEDFLASGFVVTGKCLGLELLVMFAVNVCKQFALEVVQSKQHHKGVSSFAEDAALLLAGYTHPVGLTGQSLC